MKRHVAVPEAEDLEEERRIVPHKHAVVVVNRLASLVEHEHLQVLQPSMSASRECGRNEVRGEEGGKEQQQAERQEQEQEQEQEQGNQGKAEAGAGAGRKSIKSRSRRRRRKYIREVVGLGRKREYELGAVRDPHLDLGLPPRLVRHDLSLPRDVLDHVQVPRRAVIGSMREGGEEGAEGQRVVGVGGYDRVHELPCEDTSMREVEDQEDQDASHHRRSGSISRVLSPRRGRWCRSPGTSPTAVGRCSCKPGATSIRRLKPAPAPPSLPGLRCPTAAI
eukprot:765548-Hanusia_phi.AAC.2